MELLLKVLETLGQQIVAHPDQALPVAEKALSVLQGLVDLVKAHPSMADTLAQRFAAGRQP